MAASFEQSTLRIQVARQLVGRIEKLNLKPGDKLGTEAELANELGSSLRTIREAATALKAMGMLSSRRRVGLIVTKPDPTQNLASVLPLYSQSSDNIGELRQLRYVIEIGALELAVKNITEAQLSLMQEMADQMTEMWARERWREADRCDARFHSLILEATGSKLVSSLHNVIVLFFCKKAESAKADQHVRREKSMNHHGICEAFRLRDIDRLREILAVHLDEKH